MILIQLSFQMIFLFSIYFYIYFDLEIEWCLPKEKGDSGFTFAIDIAFPILHGTDGEDGNVPVAGGWVDADWINQHDEAQNQELVSQAEHALKACRSFDFLDGQSLIFKAVATNTNVCDLRILLSR